MPFAFLTIGIIFIIAGARDTYKALGNQFFSDFSGSGSFLYWVAAIGIVGAAGYYAPWRTASRLFLVLMLVVYIVAQKGVFAQLRNALASGPSQQPQPNTPQTPDNIPIKITGGQSGGGGGLGGLSSMMGMFGGA